MSHLVKFTSSVQVKDDLPWTADRFFQFFATEYVPMAAFRGRFKLYIEDAFPWWSLPFGSLDDSTIWIVIGVNGTVKTSRVAAFDSWIQTRTERKSRRYYFVARYGKGWECDLGHSNVNVADVEETFRAVLGASIRLEFQQTEYCMHVPFMNVRSLMYAIATDEKVSRNYAVTEKKMPASYSTSVSISVFDDDSRFDVTIAKDKPRALMIKNVVDMSEYKITEMCDTMSSISENAVVAYYSMMKVCGIVCEVPGLHVTESLPSGYARYASTSNVILPQIINVADVDRVKQEGREILEHNGKLWTCPLGFFPYVTDNRKMNNNDTERTIVKCNTRAKPNTQRHTTDSHYVFNNPSHMVQDGDRGTAAGAIRYHLGTARNLVRVGVEQDEHSFLRCVFRALASKTNPVEFRTHANVNPWIAKQENPYLDPDEIVRNFRDTSRSFDSSRLYRIVEEAFNVDIVLIDMFKGDDVHFHIPSVDDVYIWRPRCAKSVVGIIRNHTVESGAFKTVYHELIAFDGQPARYNLSDSHVIANKTLYVNSQSCTFDHHRMTVRLLPSLQWEAQQLNDSGHCIALRTGDFWLTCFDRPHVLPVEVIVEENLPDPQSASTFVRSIFRSEVSHVDVSGRDIIGVWVGNVYCPTKTTDRVSLRDIQTGRRCMELKRSIFGEIPNRSKRKSVVICGAEHLQDWIDANKLRNTNEYI